MKKYYSLLIATFLLVACDDWTEKNFDIEDAGVPENVITKEYTLTEEDYAAIAGLTIEGIGKADLAAVKANNYLSSRTPAELVLPALMAKKYYSASEGSMITTTYRLASESPEYLDRMASAKSYVLNAEDYKTVWGVEGVEYLTPEQAPEAALLKILSKRFLNPEDGTVVIAEYAYSEEEPVLALPTFIDEDFESVIKDEEVALSGWTNFVEKGTKAWIGKGFNNNKYVQMSANGSNEDENIAWLVSPKVNLTEAVNPTLSFDITVGWYNANCLQILVSEDYVDDVTTATWTDITANFAIPQEPTKQFGKAAIAGLMDMSAYKKNINIAFKYTGSGNNSQTTTYQIDNLYLGDDNAVKAISVFKEDFESVTENAKVEGNGWNNFVEKGTKTWIGKKYSGNKYVQMTAKDSHEDENIAWLVSPQLDLTETKNPVFGFDITIGYWNANCLQVLVSEDYAGNVTTATWTDITANFVIPQEPTSGYGKTQVAGFMNMSAYKKRIWVAFKYTGSGNDGKTTTYQMDNFNILDYNRTVAATSSLAKANAAGAPARKAMVVEFTDGKWAVNANMLALSSEDYKAMGEPGAHNNFSSTILAENYLPKFLAVKYPYAVEGEVKAVVYNYYDGKTTVLKADEYVYAGGWKCNTIPVETIVSRCMYREGNWIVVPDALLSQDFEAVGSTSPADIPGWTTIGVKGNNWYTSLYNGNTYARCTGHNGGGVTEAWLITPAVELPVGYDLELTFDCEVGYFNAPCLSVLISTDFTGDQTKATWTDITEEFALPTAPTSGYGKFENVGAFNLKDYVGKTIHIAFRLDGDSDNSKTTTYDIDNVTIGVVF